MFEFEDTLSTNAAIEAPFDADEMASINAALGTTADPADDTLAAEGATAQAGSTGIVEGTSEGKDATDSEEVVAAAGEQNAEDKSESQESAEAKATEKPKGEEDTTTFRALRSQLGNATKALKRYESYGPVLKAADEVGVEPLEKLSFFVTGDRSNPEEYAKGVFSRMQEVDPLAADDVGQYIIGASIQTSPQPVLEELMERHPALVVKAAIEQAFGKGQTVEDIKRRLSAPAQVAAPAVKTGDDGVDEGDELDRLLRDPDDEQADKTKQAAQSAAQPAITAEEVKRQIEEAIARDRETRDQKTDQLSEAEHAERANAVMQTFVTQACEPLRQQLSDAGLTILPDDTDEEKAFKQGAVQRIAKEVIDKLKAHPRQTQVGEYAWSLKTPPAHLLHLAKALVEEYAGESIEYHTGNRQRQREVKSEPLTKEQPKVVTGNSQGAGLPGHTSRAEASAHRYGGSQFDDDDDFMAEARDAVASAGV